MSQPTRRFLDLVKLYADYPIDHPQLKPITIAQWLHETGWGDSDLAKIHNNYAGLKWRSEMQGFATPVKYKARDGWDTYCAFTDLTAFLRGYWRFIERKPYDGWEEHTGSGADYISFLKECGYAGDPDYVRKVLDLESKARALLARFTGEEGDPPSDSPGQPDPGETDAYIVVLDPGHGGSAPGTVNQWKTEEKDVVLDVALRTRDELKRQATQRGVPLRVVMTRDDDSSVGINARAQLAARENAHLFLSIHMNSAESDARGVETFYRAPENNNVNLEKDRRFAQLIQDATLQAVESLDSATKDRGIKPDTLTHHKALGVLNDVSLGNTDSGRRCLACLVELEFLDVKAVHDLFNSEPQKERTRQTVAAALAGALLKALPRTVPAALA